MRHEIRGAAIAAVLLAACNTGHRPPPQPPGPHPPVAGNGCAEAAANIEQLSCVLENVCSTSDCDDFEERCHAIERDMAGYLNTPCLAAAESCDAARKCADE